MKSLEPKRKLMKNSEDEKVAKKQSEKRISAEDYFKGADQKMEKKEKKEISAEEFFQSAAYKGKNTPAELA